MTDREAVRRRTSSRLWRHTCILALMGLVCAVLLSGLSAWFLGSVALAGLTAAAYTFNFHIPGALVRLFALGRTGARYGERLLGHQAALTDQTSHRITLFAAMAAAPSVRAASWQLADQARLAEYLDDVDDLDFARLRSDLPAAALAAGAAGAVFATGCIAALALLPLAAMSALVALSVWHLMDSGKRSLRQIRETNHIGTASFGALLGSIVPLKAEGGWQRGCEEALRSFSRADAEMTALRRAQAMLDALASLLGPVAAASVLVAAWFGGARAGELMIPVFLAFSWLALGEAAQGASRIVVAALRRRAAQSEIARWTDNSAVATIPDTPPFDLVSLGSEALQRRAPDGRPLGCPLSFRLERGRPTFLVGASGAGKTSLLKQAAGWIGDDTLRSSDGPMPALVRRSLAMYCPHDAAILTDTVRANLFAVSSSDVDLWAALEAVELVQRVKDAGGLDGWIAQEMVSLGEAQRINLARAWLSAKPLILLDEPSEHLDIEQAGRIMNRLLQHLREKIVVLSSHRAFSMAQYSELQLG